MVKLTTVLVLDDKLVFELDQEQRLKVGTFGYDPRGYLKDELHRYGTHHAALEVVKPVAAVVAAMASSVATSLPQSPGTPAPPSRRRWSVPTTPPCTPTPSPSGRGCRCTTC
jgi:hypothetical protein